MNFLLSRFVPQVTLRVCRLYNDRSGREASADNFDKPLPRQLAQISKYQRFTLFFLKISSTIHLPPP